MLPITGLDLLLDLHQVIAYHNKVTVDIDFKLGTLAERTSKQPDPPGTQHAAAPYPEARFASSPL